MLRVIAHPAAGRSSVVGQHGDALRVRVAAPPLDGRANEACAVLVAELFGVPRSDVELTTGQSSRLKRIKVSGVSPADASRLLDEALARAGEVPGRKRPRKSP